MVENSYDLEAWIVNENNTAHNKQAMYVLFDHGYPATPSVHSVPLKAWGCAPMTDAAKTVEYVRRRSGSFTAFNADVSVARELKRRFEELFLFAVVFEERQRSYEVFSRQFGVGMPCELADGNSSHNSGKPPQPARIEALIRERNVLDLALVRMASDLLDQYSAISSKALPACRPGKHIAHRVTLLMPGIASDRMKALEGNSSSPRALPVCHLGEAEGLISSCCGGPWSTGCPVTNPLTGCCCSSNEAGALLASVGTGDTNASGTSAGRRWLRAADGWSGLASGW